jgi:hypothetical protein
VPRDLYRPGGEREANILPLQRFSGRRRTPHLAAVKAL